MQRLEILKQYITQQSQKFIYSIPIGHEKKGQTRIHRHPVCKDGLLKIPSHIKNLADFWDQTLAKHGKNHALQQMTYEQLDKLSKSIGSWLYSNKHFKIYLYAKNSPQWTITDIACWNYGITNIPLYDTLGQQAFFHILKLTQGSVIFTVNQLSQSLYNNLSKNKQKLTTVVFFDTPNQQNRQKIQNIGVKVIDFKSLISHVVIQRPKVNLQHHLTYSFTSGTTGLPKGVIATHLCAISQCIALKGHYQYFQTDVHLSFLPIAHSFERFVNWMLLYSGANIRYSQFPITQITKDFARAKPTVTIMVPRLLNKFYPICKGIYQKQKSNIKIKGLFGGRIRIMVTGSAPISPQVLTFFSKTLECDVREGYGQTETTAASFITYLGDINYGHVGGPNRVTQFKLVDVPEMGCYTNVNPPRGQICTRGLSVFKGYYLDQKNTKQTIDEEGWNHSGDIGIILPNGALKIVDRKKNIYKLSQGEYVAPEKVENVYLRCAIIAQCFLYGDSLQNYNVAVIHPNLELLKIIAQKLGVNQINMETLTSNKLLIEQVLKEITEHGKKQGLYGFELAKKIILWPVSFGTLGIFTSTMKLQRHIAKEIFSKEIQQLYKQN